MLNLPPQQRKTIARTAAEAAAFAADKPVPGPRKFAIARAEGMRRLKASGMPRKLADSMRPLLADPLDEIEEDDAAELSPAERELLDHGKGAASTTVDVVADAVERAEDCKCNRQILALVKALLESGIEAAVQAAAR